MPQSSNDRLSSPLRRRMLEDMAMRGLREATQRDYIRVVQTFAAFLGRSPNTASAEDVRRFQVHQAEIGVQPPTINGSVSALRFLFTITLNRQDLSRRLVLVRHPRKLPTVLNVEEVERLVEHYNHLRDHESLDNMTPADAYFGRAAAIIRQRERIKRKTIEHRRLQHRKIAA